MANGIRTAAPKRVLLSRYQMSKDPGHGRLGDEISTSARGLRGEFSAHAKAHAYTRSSGGSWGGSSSGGGHK